MVACAKQCKPACENDCDICCLASRRPSGTFGASLFPSSCPASAATQPPRRQFLDDDR